MAYVYINKEIERTLKLAVEELYSERIIEKFWGTGCSISQPASYQCNLQAETQWRRY